MELTTHLLHHRSGGATDRGHRDAAEEVGDEAAEDQPGDDVGIGEIERDLAGEPCEVRVLVGMRGEVVEVA